MTLILDLKLIKEDLEKSFEHIDGEENTPMCIKKIDFQSYDLFNHVEEKRNAF
jgi:hypothetical protein